jgi:hypothetical protein
MHNTPRVRRFCTFPSSCTTLLSTGLALSGCGGVDPGEATQTQSQAQGQGLQWVSPPEPVVDTPEQKWGRNLGTIGNRTERSCLSPRKRSVPSGVY